MSRQAIRRKLTVTADPKCNSCGGYGLRVTNEYSVLGRKLEVTIDVCPCVRVEKLPIEIKVKNA